MVARLDQQFLWDREALQPELRKFTQAVESRLKPLDDKIVDYDVVVGQLTATGLDRVNEILIPAVQSVIDLTDLGFMTASSTSYSVALDMGTATWVIDAGPQRTNFRPTPWVYVQHNEVLGDWAVGRLLSYDHVTGELELNIEFIPVGADPGPHVNWTLSMSPAATPTLLSEVPTATDLNAKYADILVKWAAAVAAASAAAASAAAAATFDPSVYYTKTAADARYYTQTVLDAALSGKSATGHTHVAANITDFNAAADARVALAPSFSIGDTLFTMRNPGANWLLCDGSIQTTATYTALQALLLNKFAVFDTPTTPTVPAGGYSNMIWEPSVSLFIAAGSNGGAGALSTSPDGITWTSRDTTAAMIWAAATRGSVMMVAHKVAASGEVKTSSNGTSWTSQTNIAFSTNTLTWLTSVGSTWVAIGQVAECKTSGNDGTTWTTRTIPYSGETPSGNIPTAASSGSIIVLMTSLSGIWHTSTDGITWTRRTGGSWGANSQVRYVGGTFIVYGPAAAGRAKFYTSTDGINWTTRYIPLSLALSNVALVFVGYINPVFAFTQISGIASPEIFLTTDFIQFRRNKAITWAVVGTPPPVAESASVLIYGSTIQRIVFDHNTATQFKLPDVVTDVAVPRWIKAL